MWRWTVERHSELSVHLLAKQLPAFLPVLSTGGVWPRVSEMRVTVACDRAKSPLQGPCACPRLFSATPAIPGLLTGNGRLKKVPQIHGFSPFSVQEQSLLQSSGEQGGAVPIPSLFPTDLGRTGIFREICPVLGCEGAPAPPPTGAGLSPPPGGV